MVLQFKNKPLLMMNNYILSLILSILRRRKIKVVRVKIPTIKVFGVEIPIKVFGVEVPLLDFLLPLYVPLDDYTKEIVSGGLLHEPSYKFFVAYCSELDIGKKVIDLGANIGLYATTSSKMGLETIGVEMDRTNFSLLKISKKLNRLKKLSVLNFAISTRIGLNYYVGESAWASIVENIENDSNYSSSLGLSLDSLYDQNVGMIKIDVEGNELDVLESGQLFLKSEQVDFIIESNILSCGKRGYSIEKIFELMRTNGYQVFRIDHDNTLIENPLFQEVLYADCFFTKRSRKDLQNNFGFTIKKLTKEMIKSNILQQLKYHNYHRLYVYLIRDKIKTYFTDYEFRNLFIETDIRDQESVIKLLKVGSQD